jgi:hypothetical protein
MSISRHLPLLACAQVLVMSCASRPELARPQPMSSEVPHWGLESELRAPEPHAPEPHTTNPYAPTRSANPAVYFWQTDTRTECKPEVQASEPDAERPLEARASRDLLAVIPERAPGAARGADPARPDLVVAGLRPRLHHCFSRWLDDQLDAQGSVRFSLQLGCAGEVEAISAENRGVDESTLTCLFSALGPARFAPPAAGHAIVLVPVVLKNAR